MKDTLQSTFIYGEVLHEVIDWDRERVTGGISEAS